MTALAGNSLWKDISQEGSSVMDRVLGPSFDYTDGIQTPAALGVGTSGDIGQVFTNAGAVVTYVEQLITGPLLGNTQFIETGGMCTAPGGGVVPRWSYVDNRLEGADILPNGLKNALGSDADIFDGIIPGMFADIVALNPTTALSALILDGVPSCQAYACPVTDSTGNNPTTVSHFMTSELEQEMGQCQVATNQADLEAQEVAAAASAASAAAAVSESFGDQFGPPKPFKFGKQTDFTPYIYLGIAVAGAIVLLTQKI